MVNLLKKLMFWKTEYEVFINGTAHIYDYGFINYYDLANGDTRLTITYFKGPKSNPQGSLTKDGEFVKLKNGMSFTVVNTSKA